MHRRILFAQWMIALIGLAAFDAGWLWTYRGLISDAVTRAITFCWR
jgi:uncharacterized membrane protein (DUF485 family)